MKPAAVSSRVVLLAAILGAVAPRVPASTVSDFPPLQQAGLRADILVLPGRCAGDCRVSFPQDDPSALNQRRTRLDPLDPESAGVVEIQALRPSAFLIEIAPVTGNALGAPEPGTLLFVAVGLASLVFLRKQDRP
ncbi:MAG: PEP-CTERM sorting domain-containing protein [Bryobacterales bacterium]|nr:PEP-CTERM sorting domain-containing protein [Bryobacterales bacterium]